MRLPFPKTLCVTSHHLQVHNFAITVAAVKDGHDGKPIELVQHRPKRDKSLHENALRINLAPLLLPTGEHSSLHENISTSASIQYAWNQLAMEAIFERMRFKNPTTKSGGKQWACLVVELLADLGPGVPDRWLKIATRTSAPLVVRSARAPSPGHRHHRRRASGDGRYSDLGGSEGTGVGTSYGKLESPPLYAYELVGKSTSSF